MRAVKERNDKIVITAPTSLTKVHASLTDPLNAAITLSDTNRPAGGSRVHFDKR